MATVPISGTNIRLLSGIPFANDYKHTRWFDDRSQQSTWFLGRPTIRTLTNANFQRIEGQMFISVDLSIDALWGTNYLMFQNAHYNGRWFYAFVTKLEYKQINTTYVHFEIDVFQTWFLDTTFKPSYVVREHCKLWNADGSPVINTVDEGLNYGTDYDIVGSDVYMPYNDTAMLFLVIVSKTLLHGTSANHIRASMNGGAQPLVYYVHPFNVWGISPFVYNNEDDTDPNVISDVISVLNQLFTLEGAVDHIVSMYITDQTGIKFGEKLGDLVLPNLFTQEIQVVDIGSSITTLYAKALYSYETKEIEIRNKYNDFGGTYSGGHWTFPTGTEESKLLMYPYAFSIIDDFKGNRTIIKNEYVEGNSLQIASMGSMGVSNKVAYIPKNYLNQKLTDVVEKINVGLENALIDNTPHDVSILNDMLAAFFQGNRNSYHNQVNQIAFNGIMDVTSSAVGGIASALTGNVVGAVGSAVNMTKGAGNSMIQMQGMQAKVRDITNLPPSIQKMGSNTAFEYGNGYYGIRVISKQIKPEYKKKLTDFFKTYGYKVNEVKIPNFHTRLNWNFVQTNSCNILASINNEDLQELKNVFDNGITFWHTDEVGNYSLPNWVIS